MNLAPHPLEMPQENKTPADPWVLPRGLKGFLITALDNAIDLKEVAVWRANCPFRPACSLVPNTFKQHKTPLNPHCVLRLLLTRGCLAGGGWETYRRSYNYTQTITFSPNPQPESAFREKAQDIGERLNERFIK